MLSDKLMSLINSFSVTERKRFYKFLISPFFNENEELIKFYNWIIAGISSPETEQVLNKKNAWRFLYGQAVYKDVRIRRMSSELSKLIMQFLTVSGCNGNSASEVLYLLPAINSVNLSKHFVGVVRQANNQLRKDGFQNADFHHTSFQIETQSHFHLQQKASINRGLEHIRKADFHLDCFYIIHKLRHYIDLLMWKNARSIEINLHLFPDFLNHVATSKFIDVPTIAVYYNIVLVYLYPEKEDHFYTFRRLLDSNNMFFTKTEQHNIYLTAQNYCAYQINLGNLKYYRELFNIYKTLIEKSLILTKGILAPGNYKNIITVGLKVDEPEWVETFIHDFTDYLPKANQDNDRNYNLAKVYFHQKEYEKVISQLREVEYKNLAYSLGGKLMLLKTYCELEEVKALDSLMDSFRIYLHRNQLISRDVRQQYLNVLRFVRKLPLGRVYDKADVAKLREQITNCKALAAKQWLLEKVDGL